VTSDLAHNGIFLFFHISYDLLPYYDRPALAVGVEGKGKKKERERKRRKIP
jgi:hypothetical protein